MESISKENKLILKKLKCKHKFVTFPETENQRYFLMFKGILEEQQKETMCVRCGQIKRD